MFSHSLSLQQSTGLERKFSYFHHKWLKLKSILYITRSSYRLNDIFLQYHNDPEINVRNSTNFLTHRDRNTMQASESSLSFLIMHLKISTVFCLILFLYIMKKRNSSWLTGCSQADETVRRTVKLNKVFIFSFQSQCGTQSKSQG